MKIYLIQALLILILSVAIVPFVAAQIPAYKSWLVNGSSIYTVSPNIGIGTTNPNLRAKLNVVSSELNGIPLYVYGGPGTDASTIERKSVNTLALYNSRNETEQAAGLLFMLLGNNGYPYIYGRIQGGIEDSQLNTGFVSVSTSDGTGNSYERMRVTSSGNVGIGTSTPGSKLEIKSGGGGNAEGMRLTSEGCVLGNLVTADPNGWSFYSNPDCSGIEYKRSDYVPHRNVPTVVCYGNYEMHYYASYRTPRGCNSLGPGYQTLSPVTEKETRQTNIFTGSINTSDDGFITFGDGTGKKFHFAKNSDNGATKFITIQDNGSVGIGTANPQAELDVAGAIRTGAGQNFKMRYGSGSMDVYLQSNTGSSFGTVNFGYTFSSVPIVTITGTVGSLFGAFIPGAVNKTTTGFALYLYNSGYTFGGNYTFDWVAIWE